MHLNAASTISALRSSDVRYVRGDFRIAAISSLLSTFIDRTGFRFQMQIVARLAMLGSPLTVDVVRSYNNGTYVPIAQESNALHGVKWDRKGPCRARLRSRCGGV